MDVAESLSLRGWSVLTQWNGEALWMKKSFSDTGYAVLLTDLCHVWVERVEDDDVSKRYKKHNPRLAEEQAAKILRRLDSKLNAANNNVLVPSQDEMYGTLKLTMKFKLGTGFMSFNWEFRCFKLPSDEAAQVIKKFVLGPFIEASAVLAREMTGLFGEVMKRDQAIAGMKRRGGKMERNNKVSPMEEATVNEYLGHQLHGVRGHEKGNPLSEIVTLVLSRVAGAGEGGFEEDVMGNPEEEVLDRGTGASSQEPLGLGFTEHSQKITQKESVAVSVSSSAAVPKQSPSLSPPGLPSPTVQTFTATQPATLSMDGEFESPEPKKKKVKKVARKNAFV